MIKAQGLETIEHGRFPYVAVLQQKTRSYSRLVVKSYFGLKVKKMAPPAGRSYALSAGAKKRKIPRRRTVSLPRGLRRVMSMIPWADQADTVVLSGNWDFRSMAGYTSVGTGSCGVPLRYFCPPEITLHTLARQGHE